MKKFSSKFFLFEFVLPLLVLLLLTLVFRCTDLDLQVSQFFWRPEDGWWLKDFWLCSLLYERGMVPGSLIALGGLVGLVLGVKWSKVHRHWRSCLFLLLLLAIGPGLLVNSIFKEHWGRTRPVHVIELGGTEPFLTVWERGSGGGKSFPSGHASIGFYVMAPYFILRRRRRRMAQAFLIGGGLYGVLMGFGRIAQGGHFLSDVLWAWGMVYFSGLLLCYFLQPEHPLESPQAAIPCV